MCVGFGGGYLCGIGCDATGLTIYKTGRLDECGMRALRERGVAIAKRYAAE